MGKVIKITLDDERAAALERMAAARGLEAHELVKLAVGDYLRNHRDPAKPPRSHHGGPGTPPGD